MRRAAIRTVIGVIALAAAGAITLLGLAFVPTLFGAEALIVTSGSMGDAVPVGSVAVTRLVDARAVAVGDVITYRRPQTTTPITHRVIGIETDDGTRVFRTKGDANPAPDVEPVAIDGSVHKLERVVPYAGRIVAFARTPFGIVAMLIVPVAGLVVDERRRRRARTAAAEAQVRAPEPRRAEPETLLLGALAGLVVAGAIAHLGSRPARRRQPRPAG